MSESRDSYAEAVVEARLGRAPRDVIEATIVLEAWGGRPARTAMSAARQLITRGDGAKPGKGRIDISDEDDRQSVVVEGIALVLSIVSIAAWARPLSRAFGAQALSDAIRVALPIALALQWGLRSRYLSLRGGLALLARDGGACAVVAILFVALPLALIPGWGPVAAMLAAIWVGGAVMTRRGWGLLYALALVVAAVVLSDHGPAALTLLALTAFTMTLCFCALIRRPVPTEQRPGPVSRALVAALLGACIGLLLVADPSLGWGVRGLHPSLALLPSVIGSVWGGYYLWNLYDAIPRGLSGMPPHRASRRAMNGPAMALFLGAIGRLVLATVVLSAVVIALGRWTEGTDQLSVFIAFGCAALVSLQISLLESLGYLRAALIAAAAALVVEVSWSQLMTWHVPGGALVCGALVGVGLTLPPLVTLLSRSGRMLATAMWIR